ncbi:MAG: hypothetical protein ISS70_11520 [Phycisphaerae bacterium]|nr:hypothetical protein [Phycisphaerae bacterium]
MLRKSTIGLLCITLSLIAGCGQAVKDNTIAISRNGATKAVIVVAADAAEPERHAAAELADFLQQITGAKFEIEPAPAEGKSRLLIGPGAAKLAQADFSTDGLGADGIIIRNVADDLILAGGHPRGTLYAVYTFLEDNLGCRWWSSKVSTIPKKPTVMVGDSGHSYNRLGFSDLSYRHSNRRCRRATVCTGPQGRHPSHYHRRNV